MRTDSSDIAGQVAVERSAAERRNILAHLGLRILGRFQYRHESGVVVPSTRITKVPGRLDRFPAEPEIGNPSHRAERDNLSMTKTERERSLAVFIDLENLAMGFQNQRKIKFDIQKVLERLVEKGKLIVKKAYADWSRYPGLHRPVPRGGHRADRDPQAVARPARTRPTSAWSSTRWTWPGASPTSTPS